MQNEVRCSNCGRLLCKRADVNHVEIRCQACKHDNIIGKDKAGPYHYDLPKIDSRRYLRDNNDGWVKD